MTGQPRRTAVVGGGVSGLTAAYVLQRRHEVTLDEAQPRLGGHAHTHDIAASDGRPLCVVAEVHNTYGERHCYLLRPDAGHRAFVDKEFYVSPFFPVDGGYRMRLPEPEERLELTVHLERDGACPFTATVRGERRPATARALLRAALAHPLSTLAVSAGIRFHGIRLFLRKLPVQPRPRHLPQEGVK